MEAEAEAEAEAEVGGGGEVVLGASLCALRASTSSRASSPPSAALATLATTESAASALDRSRLWCARNVAASWRSGGSAPSLQRGAEVQRGAERCGDTKAKWCSDAWVKRSAREECSPRHTQLVAIGQPTAAALAHLPAENAGGCVLLGTGRFGHAEQSEAS